MNVKLGRLGILCLVGVSLILLILLGTLYFKVSRDVTHSSQRKYHKTYGTDNLRFVLYNFKI